jgi:hypothetical protein
MYMPIISPKSTVILILDRQDKAAVEAALQQKYIELLEKRISQLETVVKNAETKSTEDSKVCSELLEALLTCRAYDVTMLTFSRM